MNLTGQSISQSYQNLIVYGGGAPTDGTGSAITSLTITSSWATQATNATSASYAPVQPTYSASAATFISSKQDTLVVGNTYNITSSWSDNSISSSHAPTTGITGNFIIQSSSLAYFTGSFVNGLLTSVVA